MRELAIVATGVGKQFALAARRHDTLRDALGAAARRLQAPLRRQHTEKFWALKDLSFDLAQGEVLGIIGRNGAGKSTLLKLLSRITEPTAGEIAIRGRVGSLLEVGTGFHPELSGRENIFLNGAILGMGRKEVSRKFDEIVAFAEVERFLDTPVKHYSSGMYLRLGFAVAAHLEPDILVVDEVLAVGDAEFQKKCLGKMGEVASAGRTVVFVSHNLDAVQRLCNRCMLLERGTLAADGRPADVIARYLGNDRGGPAPGATTSLDEMSRTGSGKVRFRSVSYSGSLLGTAEPVRAGGPLLVRLEIDAEVSRTVESLAVCISDYEGRLLVNADAAELGTVVRVGPGNTLIEFRIDRLNLMAGSYPVSLWAGDTVAATYDSVDGAFLLPVEANRSKGFGITPPSNGLVYCDFVVADLGAQLPIASEVAS